MPFATAVPESLSLLTSSPTTGTIQLEFNAKAQRRKDVARHSRNQMFWMAAASEAPRRFDAGKGFHGSFTSRAGDSGAEATALQTLRDGRTYPNRAERLECGAFTAAFARTTVFINSQRGRGCALPPRSKIFAERNDVGR
jgi:hypothetical protein